MLDIKLENLKECEEMLRMLNRAANTLEPANYPEWLLPLTDRLEKICMPQPAPRVITG